MKYFYILIWHLEPIRILKIQRHFAKDKKCSCTCVTIGFLKGCGEQKWEWDCFSPSPTPTLRVTMLLTASINLLP